MRLVLDEQTYLNFAVEPSLKVVQAYRAKYAWIDECLEANRRILWLVHEDLEALSQSREGRAAKYTTEILFRSLLVHQIEGTALRETVIRIAESATLQSFVRLGTRSVPDFTFLNRAFKAIRAETWKLVNEEPAGYAVKRCGVDVSRIRTDTTVIGSNIHYPTDSSLLWDSYRVLSRLLRAVRAEKPELCPHRFHDKKARKDLVYVNRCMRSKSRDRQREMPRRFRRLHDSVLRLQDIAAPLPKALAGSDNLALLALGVELTHYLPLTRKVCRAAERAGLKGETVPASDRVFSIFEEHTGLIKRGKSNKPVESGHAAWPAQSRSKFITDHEVMEEKIPDADLLGDIAERHKAAFRKYPDGVTADMGFRAAPEEMTRIQEHVATVAVPGRGQSRTNISACRHRFRAGIEGSIPVLKRAFRLSICMYRGFKSFAASVGMAVFCHNLVNLAPKRAPT
jgi:IS5 family transposase